jgi:hypothetical protein
LAAENAGFASMTLKRGIKRVPHRMFWVEYYPEHKYGAGDTHVIPEKFDAVEFDWHGDKAIQPKWRPLMPPLLDEIKKLIQE